MKKERLLDSKYDRVLELVEELGKIRLENIDDADLVRLREELQEEGYNTSINSSTDYLVVEKEEEESILAYDNLKMVYFDLANDLCELEFQLDGEIEFIVINISDHPESLIDEYYFTEEIVKDIVTNKEVNYEKSGAIRREK